MLKWFKFGRAELAPCRPRILQVAACALLAWSWFRTDSQPPAPTPSPLIAANATRAASGTQPAADVAPQQPAFVSPVAIGASTIEVIVSHNDTLDRIFRRLKLDLADLASLRDLPGLKSGLGKLRPGEALHLIHRDGSLFGFERQLSPSETLRVIRDEEGFRTKVLENPLEK